jgi:hypothetical protein
MKKLYILIVFSLQYFMLQNVSAAPLISAKEAALPPASATATRGISRGPAIKMVSPEPDKPVSAPFDFKINFEGRADAKIDANSVKVVYMKSPFVDLTPRLRASISSSGIDFSKAIAPPGTHPIRVTVKDSDGRETNTVFLVVVSK